MKVTKRILLITQIFFSLIISPCWAEDEEEQGLDNFSVEAPTDPLLDLHVILEPKHKTVLSADVISKVKAIHKRMGDTFEEGELLIELDSAIFRDNVAKTEAVLQKTKAVLEARRRLFDANISSLLEVKEAEAAVATAQSDVTIAQTQFNSCFILGPYKGRVASVLIEEFEYPRQTGQPAIAVIDDRVLLARFLLPSTAWNALTVGDSIYIHLKEIDNTVRGVITHMAPLIDASSSTLQVEAEVENPEHQLRVGMSGSTTEPVGSHDDHFTVSHWQEITPLLLDHTSLYTIKNWDHLKAHYKDMAHRHEVSLGILDPIKYTLEHSQEVANLQQGKAQPVKIAHEITSLLFNTISNFNVNESQSTVTKTAGSTEKELSSYIAYSPFKTKIAMSKIESPFDTQKKLASYIIFRPLKGKVIEQKNEIGASTTTIPFYTPFRVKYQAMRMKQMTSQPNYKEESQ